MRSCRVIANYDRTYDDPIIGSAGDRVEIRRRDDEEPGWIWCEHAVSGRAGWVPEAFLERNDVGATVLRCDYSAMELSVVAGQELKLFETVAGWSWCESDDGKAGWVPTDKLEFYRSTFE